MSDVDDQALEQPPAPAIATPAGAIRPDSRLFIVGGTGTGKSSLARWLWATQAGRQSGHRWRVLIDSQDVYELVPQEGTCEARGVDAIDWRAEVIRFVPQIGDREEYEELYARLNALPVGVCVWLDEAVLASDSHGASPEQRIYLTQGRKHRHMHIACAQFPVHVERTIVDQSEHVFCFRLRNWADVDRMAKRMGMRGGRELQEVLHALPPAPDGMPSHHFVWHSDARDQAVIREPLTPAQLAQADKLVIAHR